MTTLLLLTTVALAGDPNTPHPQKLLPPIASKPAALKLTASEQATVEKDEPIVRSQKHDEGGSGQAVQYVRAPADIVWDVILDYPKYPSRVKNVVSATVYERSGTTLYVDMQSSIMGFNTAIYSKNAVHRDAGWMAWSLDYRRTSDVKDLTGYWRVEQIQDDPPLTRVDHATNLAITGVPGFVVNHLTKQSLVDGTAWVKASAEQLAR
jgi:ribosome-associated toxin RatA of RatAB toxin-antitoxin module